MFLTEKKLERRCTELKEYRYREVISLESFLVQEDTQGLIHPVVPTSFEGWNTLHVADRWEGRDKYLWLHKDIRIPESFRGKKVLGIFDYGNTGGGNNSGFESMFYLNEIPYQGVDANHKEVFLPDELCKEEISATFHLWSGLEGGGVPAVQEHRIMRADIAWLDEKTDDLYYMGAMILDTIRILKEEDPIKHELCAALDLSFRCIDWSCPGSEVFYESVYQADDLLNQKINAMDKHSLVNVSCVGHTHIDVAWLWRLRHTREKSFRSFTTAVRLMEQFPEYKFLQTQPRLYEYIKSDFPALYEAIKKKVSSGQWEVDGAMWVEADCNLTSGESLTRQILIGSEFIRKEFGKEVEYLWLPDVFGYSWALPQILKKAGIDMFMTTKISWNQYNRMPHDTFLWRGIDGSEVLTHFITTPAPGREPDSWFYTYNGQLLPETVKGVWDNYRDKELNKDMLISYGYGDGGGGVNRDNLEQRRRIDKIPGLPNLKTSTAGAYFRKLKENIHNTRQYVPVWDGELYLEYHRGTYTSHGYNKLMNRKMEQLYRKVEWLTSMEGVVKGNLSEAKQELLTNGWKMILTNQFHDIIPGSSIREVYEDCIEEYNQIAKIAKEIEADFYDNIVEAQEDTYTIINASGWKRNEIVEIANSRQGSYVDGQGRVLPSQRAGNVTYVEVRDIPSMGYTEIKFAENKNTECQDAFRIQGKDIETPFYIMSFNQYGQIMRLYDKTFEREILPKGERANVLQVFEDKPLDNDAWDIDIFYQEKMREITQLDHFEVKQCGALKCFVHMDWTYMNSSVSQDVILYSSSRRIDFKTKIDYHEKHQLLKAAFPIDIRSTYGTYDVQYGNVRRPNHWNTSWDQARFESVAHRWVDISEHNYGVSVLNNCKYGHDIRDNRIRITLLKAATHPDYLQDQGEHEFTYSLFPHGGDFVEGNVVQEAFALNNPMDVVNGHFTLPFDSFLSFDADQVELDAVKKSEDGKYLVIRYHEFAGSRQKVTMKPGFECKGWMEGDLRERPIEEPHNEKEICLEVLPYEIKTILVSL